MVQIQGDVDVVLDCTVNTQGSHVSLFPSKVGICHTFKDSGLFTVILSAEGEGILILEGRDGIVTGFTETCAELQEGECILRPHEVLLGDDPCRRYAGEPAAAVVGAELIAFIVTDGCRCNVFAKIRVLSLAEDSP